MSTAFKVVTCLIFVCCTSLAVINGLLKRNGDCKTNMETYPMVVNMYMGIVALVKFVCAIVLTKQHYKWPTSITFMFDSAMFFCTVFWILNVIGEDHKWWIDGTLKRALPREWCSMRAIFNLVQLVVFFPLGITGIIRAACISRHQTYDTDNQNLFQNTLLRRWCRKQFSKHSTNHDQYEDKEQTGLYASCTEWQQR